MRFAPRFLCLGLRLELLCDLGDAGGGPPVVGLGRDRAALPPTVALPSVVQAPLRLKANSEDELFMIGRLQLEVGSPNL